MEVGRQGDVVDVDPLVAVVVARLDDRGRRGHEGAEAEGDGAELAAQVDRVGEARCTARAAATPPRRSSSVRGTMSHSGPSAAEALPWHGGLGLAELEARRRPSRRRTASSTSSSVVPGSIRQSSSTPARAGMTLRGRRTPCRSVGAIVVPATGGQRCARSGCSALPWAEPRPGRAGRPRRRRAGRRAWRGRRGGRGARPRRGRRVRRTSPRSGTALSPMLGIDAWPASPSASTRTGQVPFSPTATSAMSRPSARPEGEPAALVERVVGREVRTLRHEPVHADAAPTRPPRRRR